MPLPAGRLIIFQCICNLQKKKRSFRRVVLVFFSVQNCELFYAKTNGSSRFMTSKFYSILFEVPATVVPNVFTIYPQHFSIPENSETLNSSTTKIFGTVRQKKYDGKILFSPLSLLSKNFFATRKFLKHSKEDFPYDLFCHCDTKQSRLKIVIPLPPISLISNVFRYPKLMKHQRLPLRKFRRSETKNFPTDNHDISPFIHKHFPYLKFSQTQHRRVPLRNVSVL